MLMVLLVLGGAAGALTTVAGMGGGILLLLALSLAVGPHRALAITAPALLVSNAHRLFLYRGALPRETAKLFALGAIPGSLLGGLAVSQVAPGWVQGAMVVTTAMAVLQRAGWLRWRPAAGWLAPAGALIGVLSAVAGGAGVLVGPVLMAAGLAGDAYVAGIAASAVALHGGRILAYGASGLMDPGTLQASAALIGALMAGNLAGRRLRATMSERAVGALELGVLVLSAALALVGIA